MLLADAAAQNTSIAMAIITVAGALFTWLNNRDKLKYDAENVKRITKLEADMESCNKRHGEDEKKIDSLEALCKRQQGEIDSLREKLKESEKTIVKTSVAVQTLKKDMSNSGLRADSAQVKVPDSKSDQ